MVHNPKLLILDEPTTGLDPKTRKVVWQLIDKIRKDTDMTVLLTTHYLQEAENSSYCVIMDKGHIIAKGAPNELKNTYSFDSLYSYGPINKEFEEVLKESNRLFKYDKQRQAYQIKVTNKEVKDILNKFNDYIKDFEVIKGTMDDVFLNATGKDINKEENEND